MANIQVTPAELRGLNKVLSTQAGQVSSVKSTIASSIARTNWNSPAATRFKNDWNTKYVKTLNELEVALRELGAAANTMATNYDQTEAAYRAG